MGKYSKRSSGNTVIPDGIERFLVIDLEATCDDGGAVPRLEMETIEIGAVLVDGVARGACLAVARQLVRPGVKVFLHDSDRPWYSWAKKLWPEGETIAPEKDDYPRDLWWTTAP